MMDEDFFLQDVAYRAIKSALNEVDNNMDRAKLMEIIMAGCINNMLGLGLQKERVANLLMAFSAMVREIPSKEITEH